MLIILLLALCFVGLLYFCYWRVFWVDRAETLRYKKLLKGEQYAQRADSIRALAEKAEAIPFEAVSTPSHDGLLLRARYYQAAPDAPLQILFHGYRSHPYRDFSGGLAQALNSGCNVLMVDQRAHGDSAGSCLSFGVLERMDCLCWIQYARERFGADTPVFLVGISMGAATVLMAAGMTLPENVKGVIADCGYTSPKAIVQKVMRDLHYPIWPVYPIIRLAGKVFGHFDLESASAVDALRHCRIPVLFLHGEDDRFVPCSMTLENYQACSSEKYLYTFPQAGHGLSYLADPERYRTATQDFLNHCLK